jgi:hypothetical protein
MLHTYHLLVCEPSNHHHYRHQLLVMETERFCVPEVLFRPQMVGLEQAGVGDAIGQAFDRLEHPVGYSYSYSLRFVILS